MGCRPLDSGIGLNTDFSYVQLVSGSSTEYEDVIGGMTISKLYVDAACTIPATTQNTSAKVTCSKAFFGHLVSPAKHIWRILRAISTSTLVHTKRTTGQAWRILSANDTPTG